MKLLKPVQLGWVKNCGANLLVMTTLSAIGLWGHHSHWKLPRVAEVSFAATASPTENGLPAERISQASSAADCDRHTLPGNLPAVEFRSADAARNCGIETAPADQRSMDSFVVANGVVRYDQTRFAQLAVRAPGIVWRVEKHPGDAVRRGDVLAIVESSAVGHAKADLLRAAVLHRLQTRNLERLRQIANSIPERELREVEAACELSRVQRFNAAQRLANLGFSIRPDDIDELSTDGLAASLQLLGLPSSLASETDSANLIPLIAPFDGIVTMCDVVRGEFVEPSQPQFMVVDTRQMWIDLDVRQEDAAKLRWGATVVFQEDGDLPPVSGVLTWIGTEVDPKTRTVLARAEVDNPGLDGSSQSGAVRRLLQANAFGSAHVLLRKNPAAVVVPNQAVNWQGEINHEIVFVSSDDCCRFEPRIVSKGLSHDDCVQIVGGLRAGERVVTAGSRVLSSELSERLQKQSEEGATPVGTFE